MKAEQQLNPWGQIVAKAWQDEAFKKRLLTNPAAVLNEQGMDVPTGIQIRVVANTDNLVHLTIPAKPRDDAELSDAELEGVAGGAIFSIFKSLGLNFGINTGQTPQELAAGTGGSTTSTRPTPTSPAPGTPPSGPA